MKRQLRRSWLALAMAAPFVLPTFGLAATGPTLIVNDGTGGLEANVMSNLTAKLVAAGDTVTTNVGVPAGSLATYKQIWDIRFNNTVLTPTDNSAYLTYLQGGGALFLMGENVGFITRDNSIAAFITQAGGGTLTIQTPANAETVLPPFTGPNAVTTITFLAAAGVSNPVNGAFIAKDAAGIGAALVWGPGNLGAAPAGSLIVVFDVNFMDPGADANSQALLANLIAYLATPTTVAPGVAPVPSTILLMLLGLSIVGGFEVRRRRKLADRALIL